MFEVWALKGFDEVDDSIGRLYFYPILDEAEVVSHELDAGIGVGPGLGELEDVFDILYFAHFHKLIIRRLVSLIMLINNITG